MKNGSEYIKPNHLHRVHSHAMVPAGYVQVFTGDAPFAAMMAAIVPAFTFNPSFTVTFDRWQ